MTERLAIDVTMTKETGILGTRGDDKFPVTGKRITKIEFTKDIKGVGPLGTGGHGDAYPDDTELPDVNVHYWADLYTKITYTLKVWVED